MNKLTTCFFTGHRRLPKDKVERIAQVLKNNIISLIDYGITDFVCGGALGFDYMAETILLALRDDEGYDIKIHLFLPSQDHYSKWKDNEINDFFKVKDRCDSVTYAIEGPYNKGCAIKRNQLMAKASSYCIAFLLANNTGTGSAVRYATMTGLKVINLADELYD